MSDEWTVDKYPDFSDDKSFTAKEHREYVAKLEELVREAHKIIRRDPDMKLREWTVERKLWLQKYEAAEIVGGEQE